MKTKQRNGQKALVALTMGLFMTCSVVASVPFTARAESESAAGKYTSDYDSVQGVLDASAELNEQIGDEGFVLLKNRNNNLPFSSRVRNISLFGKNSVNPVMSGTGSSGGTSGETVDIVSSLRNGGYNVNPALINFYNDTEASGAVRPSMGFSSYNYHSYFPTAETPLSKYTQEVKDSYADYGDAAVIVLSRTGGEGTDLPRTSFVSKEDEGKVPSSADARVFPTRDEAEDGSFVAYGGEGRTSDPYEHYLELDDNEEDLIKEVTSKFDKVVVILNTSNVMELDRELLIDNDSVQSIIWAPGGGQNAFNALGRILNGSVNPSGRTTDTFAADFTKDPVWQNFGNNNVGYYADGTAGNQYILDDGSVYSNNFGNYVEEVSYEEGIYTGYKYWETRGYTDGEQWYSEAVNYPFGYGLSYTEFKWSVGEVKLSTSTLNENTQISVDVTVTNIGAYAGKDVVELYYSAPYTAGATEKSHVVLGAFAKTDIIKPGKSQTVTLTFSGFDMASFDTYDKDGDGHSGYELDKGDYNLYIGKDAHDSWTNGIKKTVSLASDINIDKDPATGEEISVLFTDSNEEMKDRTLSRNDWEGTFPVAPTWTGAEGVDLVRSEEWLSNFDMPLKDGATAANAVIDPSYDEGSPWYAESAPSFRADSEAYSAENPAPIQLEDMAGVAYDNPKWDEFVSQLTVDQCYEMMQATQFQFNAQDAVGSPVAGHSDGPLGLTGAWVGGGNSLLKPLAFISLEKFGFATETLVGCTWNTDLAYRQGKLVGDYGLWAHVVGWYAPGANIHRSPFSGRNFEYYSEDATLSAYMLTSVVEGAREKGMVTFLKHYALNDQETNRDTNSVATWADEQTMRENYFKPFEWAIKKSDANGLMSAFNRIGFDWCGANYTLLAELTRGEWGFKGVVITDAHGSGYGSMNANQMIRAGNDMSLDSASGSIARIVNSEEANTPTQLTALHNAMKHIFYTVVNSAAMNNGLGSYGASISYTATGASVEVGANGMVDIDVSDGEEGATYTIMTGSLPAGVELDNATGKISGTIADSVTAGTYTVRIAKVLAGAGEGEYYLNSAYNAWGLNGMVTFTITVTEDGATANVQTPVSVIGFEKLSSVDNVDYYVFYMSDGTEYYFTVTNGVDGADGVDGINGTDGKDGINGTNGMDGKDGADGKDGVDASGCNGSITQTIAAASAALVLAAVVIVVRKRKSN